MKLNANRSINVGARVVIFFYKKQPLTLALEHLNWDFIQYIIIQHICGKTNKNRLINEGSTAMTMFLLKNNSYCDLDHDFRTHKLKLVQDIVILHTLCEVKTKLLFTHSLCYIYFSQFIHHILFNVSANQSLYQESFSFNVT